MITTIVTTSTIAIVNMYAVGGTLALMGIIALATLLMTKDVSGLSTDKMSRRINQAVNIAIFPLIILFLVIVIAKILSVLS